MSVFNESRRVSYSTDEFSCRYLSIDLPLSLRSPTYTGKFGQELKKFGIEKFPFGITLSDLILCGALAPSLYVALPREYFDGWTNFPQCPRQGDNNDTALVGMYACQLMPQLANSLNDLLHPYDGDLKSSFREKFQTEIPKSLSGHDHSSGVKYIPAEAYLPYWQVYALAGNFHEYRHAERFLSPAVGKPGCLQLIKSAARSFIKKYGDAFDRVSWYKTIVASAIFSESNFTSGQLIELAQKHSKVTVDVLKEDLKLLLELDADWSSILKKYGCMALKKARSNLSKEIYLIYEQLRLLGVPSQSIFHEFSLDNRIAVGKPLHKALQLEEYELKRCFLSLGRHYCTPIEAWGYQCTDQVFDDLIKILGFDSWIRAFHDLHKSINDSEKQPVSFQQTRIVDALIVMSVRTEIVLREMFRDDLKSKDETIVSLLRAAKSKIQTDAAKITETCCNEIKSKTKLNDRPVDLFRKIDEFNPCNWSNENIFFLHALLKFVTARNYFAHHAYKDDELNIQTSALSKQILESLLATLLFFWKTRKQEI